MSLELMTPPPRSASLPCIPRFRLASPSVAEEGQRAPSHAQGGQGVPSYSVRNCSPQNLDSDLCFLLQEHKVVDDNILLLDSNGIESISDFAGMEGSEEDLRETLLKQFNLGKDVKSKVQVSRTLQAFSDAKERVKARSKVKAIATAQGDTVDMPPTEYIALVNQLEISRTPSDAQDTTKISHDHLPARCVVEAILDALSRGEFTAPPLAEIVSLQEESVALLHQTHDHFRRQVPPQVSARSWFQPKIN